jgi:hypothetical protein
MSVPRIPVLDVLVAEGVITGYRWTSSASYGAKPPVPHWRVYAEGITAKGGAGLEEQRLAETITRRVIEALDGDATVTVYPAAERPTD